MTFLDAAAAGIAVLLLTILLISARRPLPALALLLCLLPFHTGLILVLRNWVGTGDLLVQMVGAWKEAVLVGLVLAAAARAWRARGGGARPSLITGLGLVFLAIVALRSGLDLLHHGDLRAVLFGARNLAEFAVLMVTVAVLRPGPDLLRRTAWTLVPIAALVAEIALAVLAFGLPLYTVIYRNVAGTLNSSFLVQFGGEYHARASGTYISPNEFGLAMAVFMCAVIVPLWPEGQSRRLLAASGTLVSVALLLSYSRSAWLGLVVGVLVVAILLRRRLFVFVSAVDRRFAGHRRVGVGILAAAALLGLLAVSTRAVAFLLATFRGAEPSAAGRSESLVNGLAVLLHSPLGLGIGSAGPKAVGLDPTAILTENWYLVYGIQLGWAGLAALALLAAVTVTLLARRVRAASRVDGPIPYGPRLAAGALAALVGALVGGLVIPSFLDLPGSMTIWALAVAAAGLTDDNAGPVSAGPTARSSDA